ncbi:EI24 domain-containing protein [Stakelama marina]|uniref:EI24 domain-containing protein n=1 Tax=Stakelama marina TaxID=2826939 RepID=A0A8T4IMR8_9SPHN|nr:EI24 domain-containing protein [Stakelama marina]MBR0553619.1 EI24 domain-containing protein [Stakelama marina]
MLRALFLSVAQLGDPPFLKVFAKSLALTLAIFAIVGVALVFAVKATLSGQGFGGTVANLAAAATLVGELIAVWLLFRAVAIAVIGIFADDIVHAVEAKHYPTALANARDVALMRSVRMGLGSAARAILVNIALSPLYLLLLVTGIGTAAAFFIVNGWLLGRDLGDMVAARHLAPAAMRDWRAATRIPRFILGLAATALLVVPFVNLIAPVLGAAMATHMFHDKGAQ